MNGTGTTKSVMQPRTTDFDALDTRLIRYAKAPLLNTRNGAFMYPLGGRDLLEECQGADQLSKVVGRGRSSTCRADKTQQQETTDYNQE